MKIHDISKEKNNKIMLSSNFVFDPRSSSVHSSLMPVFRPLGTDVGTASWTRRPWDNLKGGLLWQRRHPTLPPLATETQRSGVEASKRYKHASVCLGVHKRLRGSIVCHSSFSEKVPVNQSHALGNTALNEIQWTDWVSDGWFTYIQPELSDRETLTRRVEEVRVG